MELRETYTDGANSGKDHPACSAGGYVSDLGEWYLSNGSCKYNYECKDKCGCLGTPPIDYQEDCVHMETEDDYEVFWQLGDDGKCHKAVCCYGDVEAGEKRTPCGVHSTAQDKCPVSEYETHNMIRVERPDCREITVPLGQPDLGGVGRAGSGANHARVADDSAGGCYVTGAEGRETPDAKCAR